MVNGAGLRPDDPQHQRQPSSATAGTPPRCRAASPRTSSSSASSACPPAPTSTADHRPGLGVRHRTASRPGASAAEARWGRRPFRRDNPLTRPCCARNYQRQSTRPDSRCSRTPMTTMSGLDPPPAPHCPDVRRTRPGSSRKAPSLMSHTPHARSLSPRLIAATTAALLPLGLLVAAPLANAAPNPAPPGNFSSSFESADPQPATSTVEVGANGKPVQAQPERTIATPARQPARPGQRGDRERGEPAARDRREPQGRRSVDQVAGVQRRPAG